MEQNFAKEQLKNENNFLKMKLMLERGAEFGMVEKGELDPAVENTFLKNVIEFEEKIESGAMVKMFDKIGRPDHFKPADQIAEEDIGDAWKELSGYLFKHGISVSKSSPNVSVRELYRFATEELFEIEMDDIDIPGLINGFIYDEFYPDVVYENSRMAVESMEYIFSKNKPGDIFLYEHENIRLNQHYPLTRLELKDVIEKFRNNYDKLTLKEMTDLRCEVNDDLSTVTGKYSLTADTGVTTHEPSGNWRIVLKREMEIGYWYINEIYVQGIDFEGIR